jgi:hypothetical protein
LFKGRDTQKIPANGRSHLSGFYKSRKGMWFQETPRSQDRKLSKKTTAYGRIFAFFSPGRTKRFGRRYRADSTLTGGAKFDWLGRFLDESIIADLEREGFFKHIAKDGQK